MKTTLALFSLCLTVAFCVEKQCEITAVVRYSDCQLICRLKYGAQKETQRLFFNHETGICQKKVYCSPPLYGQRYYNICINIFLLKEGLQSQQTSAPELIKFSYSIVKHGSYNQFRELECYPGYISSYKKIEIEEGLTRNFYCDIEIGDQNYPQTHGELFFLDLSNSQMVSALEEVYPRQLDFGFIASILVVLAILLIHFVEGYKYLCAKYWK